MEGNEIEKAAEDYDKRMHCCHDAGQEPSFHFTAGANCQKERENAEIVQLKLFVEELKKSTHLLHEAMTSAEMRGVQKGREEKEAELTRANARIEELSKALKDLCDLQNGPPLPTYEKDFNEVMERCYKLLGK